MGHHREAFIGIDTAKLRNAVAVGEGGRDGELRYLGEVDTSEAATRKRVGSLVAKYRKLVFCYEAGPTGYGLQRLIESMGHTCLVVAPSLIPRKAGVRVKTNRRDAEGLARLLRAGELTAVWVPDARHEAMRELTRARDAARQDQARKRQQVSSMMLRLGKIYHGVKTCNARHRAWLARLKLDHREQRLALEEMLQAERQAGERVDRLDHAIREAVADWSLGAIVPAMRGIDTIAAVTILAEVGDLERFGNPRQLMAYLGLVPSERSTGESVKRGGITKTGNNRARRILVEAAWSYRHPPRVGVDKQVRVTAAPRAAREIAWKAQVRLCKRFRALSRKGKKSTIVATAIARELAAFIWAIARTVSATAPAPTA